MNASPTERIGAFQLVDYLLYVFAVFFIFKNLFNEVGLYYHHDLIKSWNTEYLLTSRSDSVVEVILNFVLAIFILVVYFRNYIVMTSIDLNPSNREDSFLFLNDNCGSWYFLERILRIFIVFLILVSAGGTLKPFTTLVTSAVDCVLSAGNQGDFSRLTFMLGYYSIVLSVLFLTFIIYDISLVISTWQRNKNEWKATLCEQISYLKQEIVVSRNKDKDLLSLLKYLNFCSTRDDGTLHFEISIHNSLRQWVRDESPMKIYLSSIKFKERLSGLAVCISVLLTLPYGYNQFLFTLIAVSLIWYCYCLFQNEDFHKSLLSTLFGGPIRCFLLIYRKSPGVYVRFKIGEFVMNNKVITISLLGIVIIATLTYFNVSIKQNAMLPKQGVLVVWQTESDPAAVSVLEEIEKEFERQNPGFDLQIQTVGWGDLSKNLGVARRKDEFPDVSHIQPFMAYSLISKGLLSPITEFVEKLDETHGGILPAVRDLQSVDGKYYGIAHAVGTTFWLTRSDRIDKSYSLEEIVTWDDYLKMVAASHAKDKEFLITIPGGSPFFIHQLYGELLANAGGRFFNPETLEPELNSRENIAVLRFFQQISKSGALDSGWRTTTYAAQFDKVADNQVHGVPVTYARASKKIDLKSQGGGEDNANSTIFSWLNQPIPKYRSGNSHIATIDAEPYVVFSQASERKYHNGLSNYDLSLKYLDLFYSEKYYKKFTAAVPVHLTPIFRDMASSTDYLKAVGRWTPWHNKTMALLSEKNHTRPIMMPDNSEQAKKIPFLLEFEASGIISKAVFAAISDMNADIDQIADKMQDETTAWLKAVDY